MRAAVIQDLPGHFGPIEADGIWQRVSHYHLDRLYFDIRQINNHIIDECKKHSTIAGINIDPKSWFNEDLAASAIRVSRKLNDLGFDRRNPRGICPVLFDYEEHSIEKVIAGLQAWRRTRGHRDTIWSFEPLQGGWVRDPQMQAQIKPDRNLILMPQTYRGGMEPVAQDAVLEDLTSVYAPQQVKLYYQSFYKKDAADVFFPVQEAWDGCMYDLEHMPLP